MMFRTLHTALFVIAPLALAACGDATSQDSGTDTTSISESSRAADAAQARRPPPPGPLMLIDVALREVELTDSQRETLSGLAASGRQTCDAAHESARSIEKKLAVALRVASLDAANVQAEIEALSKKRVTERSDIADALDVLHATLTLEQRQAVVQAVQRNAPPPRDSANASGAPGLHVPPPEGAMPPPEGAMPPPGGAPRDPFADLNLTEAQISALEAKLGPRPDPSDRRAEHEKRRGQVEALLAGFAADDFEAAKFVSNATDADPRREHLERQLRLTQAALEVLDDAQRETLAARMTQRRGHANRPARGKR